MSTKIKWSKSLSTNLLKWFLLLSLAPIIFTAVLAYKNSSESLFTATSSELKHSSSSYVNFINNWFFYRKIDINSWSSNKNSIAFIQALNGGLKKSDLTIAQFVTSKNYVKLIEPFQDDLIKLTKEYDYVYDLFLFDTQGNLLFTVAKEDDLGTNFFNGKYSSTKFAKIIQKIVIDREVHFSDFEFYSPSKNEVFGFLSAPIMSEEGNVLGSFAIQVKPNRIFTQFEKINKEDNGIFHYLLGEDDFLLRTSLMDESEILKREIKTEQTKQYVLEKTHIYDENSAKKEIISHYNGPNKVDVIGVHHHINILGVRWVLISEMEERVAFSSSYNLALQILLIVIVGIVMIIFTAIYISRKITQPISALVEASESVAQGKREVIWIKEDNEIGVLADAFNDMVDELRENERVFAVNAKESQKSLHELKEQKLALDSHSIVAITDVKGNIKYANRKFEEISGYSHDELMGANHRILKSDEQDKGFWEEMYATITKGYIWNAEIRNRAKDGHMYWVDTTIIPFLDEEGTPESYIALRTDITEQKQNEMELLRAKDDAEAALVAKSEFLASMSHEIRTPMNGVIGMLGLLHGSKLNDTQAHQISLAESSAQSLLSLINDILDFSKVEAGKLELENLAFNLRDELGEVAEAIGHRAQDNDIEIILDVREVERQNIICDPGRLRQILNNLIGNAIKFTHDGEILIKVRLEEESTTQGRLFVSIKDSGIGIPENKLSTLFDSFTQVDASTTRKYGGTGLGLAIVKRLTTLMNGSIKVTSVQDEGSTFSFDIGVEFPQERKETLPSFDINKRRILVVDDNESNRQVLCEQFEHWGMSAFAAENSKEALELCKQALQHNNEPPFDITVIDMHLKEEEGADLGKELQSIDAYKEMKMVMMTSLAIRGDLDEFKKIGFKASFPKPATTKDLNRALHVLVEDDTIEGDSEHFVIDEEETVNQMWPNDARILLVDDNMTNQIVANGILETFGLEADTADNGEEALEALKSALETKPYDVVLMDCQMPVLDGYGATEAIRRGEAGEENKAVAIIAMTANAMKGDKEKCFASGMDEYISKPINPEKLKEALHKWLNKSELKQSDSPDAEKSEEVMLSVWDKEDAITRLGGSASILAKVIKVYLEEDTKQFNTLQSAIKNENIKDAELYAHSIKGSAANISALKLTSLAKELESNMRNGEMKEAQKDFDALKEESQKVKEVLLTYLKQSL